MNPGESSDSVGIDDAGGVLLDGRGMLFDSVRVDLGGGQVNHRGEIKSAILYFDSTRRTYGGPRPDREYVDARFPLSGRPGWLQSTTMVRLS